MSQKFLARGFVCKIFELCNFYQIVDMIKSFKNRKLRRVKFDLEDFQVIFQRLMNTSSQSSLIKSTYILCIKELKNGQIGPQLLLIIKICENQGRFPVSEFSTFSRSSIDDMKLGTSFLKCKLC